MMASNPMPAAKQESLLTTHLNSWLDTRGLAFISHTKKASAGAFFCAKNLNWYQFSHFYGVKF